jgi:type IV pilus assembly protein PilV
MTKVFSLRKKGSPQKGFTLVEVLIALIVLSIGMLGMAALLLKSLQSGRSSLYRTQAITLAAGLADRMRANRVPAGVYACGDPCDAGAGGDAIAAADLGTWVDQIETALPAGEGGVEYTPAGATTPANYLITVRWTEPGYPIQISYTLRADI